MLMFGKSRCCNNLNGLLKGLLWHLGKLLPVGRLVAGYANGWKCHGLSTLLLTFLSFAKTAVLFTFAQHLPGTLLGTHLKGSRSDGDRARDPFLGKPTVLWVIPKLKLDGV